MTRLADHGLPRARDARLVERLLKITVLSGGPSAEREVSLKSGQAVAGALRSLGHEVTLSDIDPASLAALEIPADMIFIALHGTFGEDGQLQRILDQRGLTYCGSGAAASALAMDKLSAKCRFVEHRVPTPPFDVVTPDRLERICAQWTAPAVIKPVCEGSSVGCRIIRQQEDLRPALTAAIDRYGRCLIEKFIAGPELTVGVLGEEVLPPIQIRTACEFYNYEAKYLVDTTQYLFEIDLPPATLAEIRGLSLRAHQSLGCRDFSRVDWMVDTRTGEPYALEVNTIPGFTDHSLLPKAAARAGYDFPRLCGRIVELAMSRSAGGQLR